jgi:hypothetical protein
VLSASVEPFRHIKIWKFTPEQNLRSDVFPSSVRTRSSQGAPLNQILNAPVTSYALRGDRALGRVQTVQPEPPFAQLNACTSLAACCQKG